MTKHELAAKIQDTARQAFGDGKLANLLRASRPPRREAATAEIKRSFHDLGRKLGYHVDGCDCSEFKYDLAWRTVDADKYTTHLAMILESEFNNHNPKKGPVDIDFVKLVVGRHHASEQKGRSRCHRAHIGIGGVPELRAIAHHH